MRKLRRKIRDAALFTVAILFLGGSANKAKPMPPNANLLGQETSPYLLQHAENPVNWLPWSEEAFNLARQLNRPIFLSIGYSTCHWCHVMREESFEDKEISQYLNENYIAIKVDREERPDIDAIYIDAVETMTGSSGWPLTVWMTPDKKPFYGGTYFPARDGDRGASIGLLTLLKQFKDIYATRKDEVIIESQKVVEAISKTLHHEAETKGLPTVRVMQEAFKYFESRFDANNGGLSSAPKFPSGLPLRFLYRYHRRFKRQESLQMAVTTLKKMAEGGIHDQIGGGFHRYSVDEKWMVPHFEKMLADNALLALTYLDGFVLTGDPRYADIVRSILDFVLREMTSNEGGFYAAIDADSVSEKGEKIEGYYFTWTPAEISKTLPPSDALLAGHYFDITAKGNLDGRTVLSASQDSASLAKKLNLSMFDFSSRLLTIKSLMLEKRNLRPPPFKDTKINTDWNALMISAFAKAGFVLNEKKYLDRATSTAQLIQTKLIANDQLSHSLAGHKKSSQMFLDDYAFFIAALLDLFEATQDSTWLDLAASLQKTQDDLFWDEKNGGYFLSSKKSESHIVRVKTLRDRAIPSGNSVASQNLLRLSALTTSQSYRKKAEEIFQLAHSSLEKIPAASAELLNAIDSYVEGAKQIVIVTPKNKVDEAKIFIDELRKIFRPNLALVVIENKGQARHTKLLDGLTKFKKPLKNKTTAYVCNENICKIPATDVRIFSELL